ncbi:hypothetical protein CGZ69_15885 [Streptomyces peucetius subsp. caesius ATCC 27952]|nr:hypothetical protein CGZ69_15885 [Streptomyces peucetius subsp. caesius ATCC 27952]
MGAITTKGRKLHQIEHVPYEKAFLIGDLLTSNITMLVGEPKAGKTNFAAGMSAALLNGADEFLGRPVLRPCRRIVFGLTDDGAEGELRERLHGAVPRDSVTVFPWRTPVSQATGRASTTTSWHWAPISSSSTTCSAPSATARTSPPP